jgi:hypothetical protein
MPFPGKKHKSKEEEHYNRFCEWMKPLFLQIPLTDAIRMPPYEKYMKDIVTNKRKIPNEEISTLLANYSFDGKVPEKLGDLGIPTIPCSINNNYVRTALCDLGAGVRTTRNVLTSDPSFWSLDGHCCSTYDPLVTKNSWSPVERH